MKNKEQIYLFKRFSFLTKAGLSTLDSLKLINGQTKNRQHVRILSQIIEDVSSGNKLSLALSRFPKVFSEFTINIIDFGESSGTLNSNLDYLVDEMHKSASLYKKIVNALIYPLLVTFSTLLITIFLITYLFPKIIPVFQSMNIKLPLSTKLIIFITKIVKNDGGYILISIFIIFGTAYYFFKNSEEFKYLCDYCVLRIPLVGNGFRKYYLANGTRILGLLLKSGLTLSDSLLIAKRTSSNYLYKEEYGNIANAVDRGDKVSSRMGLRPDLFPYEISQVISVGEKSGKLSDSLIYISEALEIEIDDFTKNLSTLIEPLMMIVMGIIMGFIAISIISPIYSITENLNN